MRGHAPNDRVIPEDATDRSQVFFFGTSESALRQISDTTDNLATMSETTPSSQPRRPEGPPPASPGQPPHRPSYDPPDASRPGEEDTRPLPFGPYAYGQPGGAHGHSPGGQQAGSTQHPGATHPLGGAQPHSPTGNGRRPRRLGVASVVAVAVAAGLVGGGTGTAATYLLTRDQAAWTSPTSLDQAPISQNASNAPVGSVQQVANKVLPSVVSITIATSQGSGNGSGIVLSRDGLVLTNNHVVEAATQGGSLAVTFNDGKKAAAEVVGRDPMTDLAVIRAEGVSGLTPAQLGRSGALQVGQDVVAIGSPLGLSGTVTSGIVSALNRPVSASGSQDGNSQPSVIDGIQTDAAINPGNSGGALVNMSGQVVGINSAIATLGASMGNQGGSIGVGFAIPIDQARPIAQELIKNGKAEHALLGVAPVSATSRDGTSEGAAIQSITPGGAAEGAGLKRGDVVTKVDDRLITDDLSLVAVIRSHRPGDKVTITFERDGKIQTVSATLGTDEGRAPEPIQQEQQQPQEEDQGGLPFPFGR
jgi:putative serine protease PepD